MSLPAAQRRAIEEVFKTLCSVTKGRRKLCEMFMKLPDKETWSGYYKVGSFHVEYDTAVRGDLISVDIYRLFPSRDVWRESA